MIRGKVAGLARERQPLPDVVRVKHEAAMGERLEDAERKAQLEWAPRYPPRHAGDHATAQLHTGGSGAMPVQGAGLGTGGAKPLDIGWRHGVDLSGLARAPPYEVGARVRVSHRQRHDLTGFSQKRRRLSS